MFETRVPDEYMIFSRQTVQCSSRNCFSNATDNHGGFRVFIFLQRRLARRETNGARRRDAAQHPISVYPVGNPFFMNAHFAQLTRATYHVHSVITPSVRLVKYVYHKHVVGTFLTAMLCAFLFLNADNVRYTHARARLHTSQLGRRRTYIVFYRIDPISS